MLIDQLHRCIRGVTISKSPLVAAVWMLHITIFAGCGILAFVARFEPDMDLHHLTQIAWAVPVWVIVKAVVFRLLQLDRGWWRYASVPDMVRIGFGNIAGAALSFFVLATVAPVDIPRSVYILDLLLCTHATGGVRLLARLLRDLTARSKDKGTARRIVIYGAGDTGAMLLREIRSHPRLAYHVHGFIDDDPVKQGMRIQLVPVLGTGDHLPAIAERDAIEEVLIAIPSATGPQMTGILHHCQQAGLRCKTVPGLPELIEDRRLTPQIREVAVEDLLGRSPVHLDETSIRRKLEGKTILVTGAAGSIGSEICRQLARFRPHAIVAMDVSETPLFFLEQEMGRSFPGVRFYPEVGSIQSPKRIAEILQWYSPSALYHAAAYKHVPMMEGSLFEAAENNILGTANVALAAAEHGLTDFVMISSDKAVRPTNIMGLTKRVAELYVASLWNGGTKFVSVRFGNVLGSNGSVIPIFKRQIAEGGPVTVTHPEMRRYFMTIPEAVQLVLQASTMGRGGEIFVLDMGQPVKILDLARNLILLSGLWPEKDIKIAFTGIRPGEKLYEELSTLEEATAPTFHQKIKVFTGQAVTSGEMDRRLRRIRHLCSVRDPRQLVLEMKDLVPEYNPSKQVLRWLLEEAQPVRPDGRVFQAAPLPQ